MPVQPLPFEHPCVSVNGGWELYNSFDVQMLIYNVSSFRKQMSPRVQPHLTVNDGTEAPHISIQYASFENVTL